MDDTLLAPERVLIAAAVVLTAVVFLPSAADPVNVVKLTLLVLCVLGMLTASAVRVVRSRVAAVPTGWTLGPALGLLLAFVVAAVVAPVAHTPIFGTYGRNSGLLAYAAAIVVFLVGTRCLDRARLLPLRFAVLAAGLFTSTYGLFQLAGIDAIAWSNPFNPVIAALGNPDFASGYMGICVPVTAGMALSARLHTGLRVAAGITAVLCGITAAASSAIQGPLAAAAGLGLLGLGWTLNQVGQRRRAGLVGLGGLVAVGLLTGLVGVLGHGPLASAFSGISYRARTWYWEAALTMFGDKPLFGVGLDMYGGYWWRDRPIDSIRELGGGHFSDAAHSVPLQMLAQGGVLLGLAYAVFVGYVGVRLVQGMRRLQGEERLLLAGVGGGWLAYQVQSVVSIDQVPLIVTHFALGAATLVAADAVRLRELRLPGAPARPVQTGAKRRGPVRAPRPRVLNGTDYALLSGVTLVALVLAWQSLVLLRADIAARQGLLAQARGNGNEALTQLDHATDLTPGVASYWTRKVDLLNTVKQPQLALQASLAAAHHDPYSLSSVRAAASAAENADRIDEARALFAQAVRLDPDDPETLTPAAAFELRHGGAATAKRWLSAGVGSYPDSAVLWTTFGEAGAAAGDTATARTAFERALELDPKQTAATAGLAALGAR